MHGITKRWLSMVERSSSPTSSTTSRSEYSWPPLQVGIVNSTPSSHPRSRKPCSVKSGFQTLRSVIQNRSSGTRRNTGSSTRLRPRRLSTMMKGKKMTPARIQTKCRPMLPVYPRSRTLFLSRCTDRAVRATRAQYVCSTQGGSFFGSLTERADYLLQAYESCPEDPLICMSLAIASLSRAMQRQADNRHHTIAQVGSVHSSARVGSEFLSGFGIHVPIQETSRSGPR